jgi:hypothetical protein
MCYGGATHERLLCESNRLHMSALSYVRYTMLVEIARGQF